MNTTTIRLLLGTTNPGKITRFRHYLRDLPLTVLSPEDLDLSLDVSETELSPEDNARIKAVAWFGAS